MLFCLVIDAIYTRVSEIINQLKILINIRINWSVDTGLRYGPIESMGVKLGADISKGPEDFAFCISLL